MPISLIFLGQMVLGYLAWMLCFTTYGLPKLRAMEPVQMHRAIATLHGFRFFGLVFIVPGVIGAGLPAGFAPAAAYGDFATGLLALLALASVRVRPLFWTFVVGFNVVGIGDLLFDYWHAVLGGLPEHAGALGGAYFIPVIYVPLLMITHVFALTALVRSALTHAGLAQRSPSLG